MGSQNRPLPRLLNAHPVLTHEPMSTQTPTRYSTDFDFGKVKGFADDFTAGRVSKSEMLNAYVIMPGGHRKIVRDRVEETANGIYAKWERLNDLAYLFQEWDKATKDK